MMDLDVEWARVKDQPSDIRDHLTYFVDLCVELNAQRVIELGVRYGTSTIAWLYGLEQTGGHLWSVDIDPAPDWLEHPRWSFAQGHDLGILGPNVWTEGVDVVFIDTSHHYRHTQLELALYGPLVRPGGRIILHDTEVETPYKAPRGDPPFPVARAVREYVEAHQLDVVFTAACNGLAVIYT